MCNDGFLGKSHSYFSSFRNVIRKIFPLTELSLQKIYKYMTSMVNLGRL